jgi:hypothetical protein
MAGSVSSPRLRRASGITGLNADRYPGSACHVWLCILLDMSVSDRGTTHDGLPMRRSGDTSSVLRRQPEGAWIITRDANTLVPEPVMFPA